MEQLYRNIHNDDWFEETIVDKFETALKKDKNISETHLLNIIECIIEEICPFSEKFNQIIKLLEQHIRLSYSIEKKLLRYGFYNDLKIVKEHNVITRSEFISICRYHNFLTMLFSKITPLHDAIKTIMKNNNISADVFSSKPYIISSQKSADLSVEAIASFLNGLISNDIRNDIIISYILLGTNANIDYTTLKKIIDNEKLINFSTIEKGTNFTAGYNYGADRIQLKINKMIEADLFVLEANTLNDSDIINYEKRLIPITINGKSKVMKPNGYVARNMSDFAKTRTEFYSLLIKKFKYVQTQKIWDFCFDNNCDIIFNVISKLDVPTNIKFVYEHMEKACQYNNLAMIAFLLNQRIKPAEKDIQALTLKNTKETTEILEVIKKYSGVNKVITLQQCGFTDDELKTEKRKFFLKSNYAKLEKKPSVLGLQQMFIFDALDNIKKYIDSHSIDPDKICCENALFNEDANVLLYVLDTYKYKPSVLHITKCGSQPRREYLLGKFYPELANLDNYNKESIVLPKKEVVEQGDNRDCDRDCDSDCKPKKVAKKTIKKTVKNEVPIVHSDSYEDDKESIQNEKSEVVVKEKVLKKAPKSKQK